MLPIGISAQGDGEMFAWWHHMKLITHTQEKQTAFKGNRVESTCMRPPLATSTLCCSDCCSYSHLASALVFGVLLLCSCSGSYCWCRGLVSGGWRSFFQHFCSSSVCSPFWFFLCLHTVCLYAFVGALCCQICDLCSNLDI